jgi:hypothetical protein
MEAWDIVYQVESDLGAEYQGDPPGDILCNHDSCFRPECDCQEDFRKVVTREIEKTLCSSCTTQADQLCVVDEDSRYCQACYKVYYENVVGDTREAMPS